MTYNSLLDDVAGEANVGRVSGFGWGMGYLGGIVVLLVIYFGFIQPDVGWFGVTGDDGMDIRVSMLVCAIWTLLFTIPTFAACTTGRRLSGARSLASRSTEASSPAGSGAGWRR